MVRPTERRSSWGNIGSRENVMCCEKKKWERGSHHVNVDCNLSDFANSWKCFLCYPCTLWPYPVRRVSSEFWHSIVACGYSFFSFSNDSKTILWNFYTVWASHLSFLSSWIFCKILFVISTGCVSPSSEDYLISVTVIEPMILYVQEQYLNTVAFPFSFSHVFPYLPNLYLLKPHCQFQCQFFISWTP